MIYLTLKSLHIVAVILWIGALCLVSFITSSNKMDADLMQKATRVTEAAIGVTWLAGIVLVVMGSWYASTWWLIKVFLVIVISAIHTFFHRRWKSGAEAASTPVAVPYTIVFLTLIIVLLVVLKQPV